MPFRSYGELINMASKNPKLAKSKVAKAQGSSKPIVDSDNPGYKEDPRSKAINRRLGKNNSAQKTRMDSAVRSRMSRIYRNITPNKTEGKVVTPQLEDKIVTQRKKVGY